MRISGVHKILIFRICCLGDVVMLTPVITSLHSQFPGAEIKIASSKWVESLLRYLPDINGALLFDTPFEKGFFRRLTGSLKFIRTLRKEKFDMVFTAHRNNIFGTILFLAGIRYRLGFKESSFMTHAADYDLEASFVERHLKILKENGINAGDRSLHLVQNTEKEKIKADNNLSGSKFIVGIFPFGGSNPGTQMHIKRWEYSKYIDLIKKYTGSSEITFILFNGQLPDEKSYETSLPGNVVKLNLTFDLISICNIFVCCDTGPLFIAEGFGVSTLSIFGPSDAERIAPKSTHSGTIHRCIWKKPSCAPCYTPETAINRSNPKYWQGNTFKCHTGTHECISDISVEEVKHALDEMITNLVGSKVKHGN